MKNTSFRSLWAAVVLVVMLAGMVACEGGGGREAQLAKKWKYDSMEMSGQTLSGDQIGNPTMEFKTDGTVHMKFGDLDESGTWKLEGDTIITTIGEGESFQDQEVTIVELTDEKLIISGEQAGQAVTVTLVPSAE